MGFPAGGATRRAMPRVRSGMARVGASVRRCATKLVIWPIGTSLVWIGGARVAVQWRPMFDAFRALGLVGQARRRWGGVVLRGQRLPGADRCLGKPGNAAWVP
jgi:hypothetical protein